jgi:hypothetical protein
MDHRGASPTSVSGGATAAFVTLERDISHESSREGQDEKKYQLDANILGCFGAGRL